MALQRPVVFKTKIVLAQMRPAIEEELHRIRAGKHGQPLDYCAYRNRSDPQRNCGESRQGQPLASGGDDGTKELP